MTGFLIQWGLFHLPNYFVFVFSKCVFVLCNFGICLCTNIWRDSPTVERFLIASCCAIFVFVFFELVFLLFIFGICILYLYLYLTGFFVQWNLFYLPAGCPTFSFSWSSWWRWLLRRWQLWWWWWWRWLWSAVVVNKHLVATGALGNALGGGRWAWWAWYLWCWPLQWLMLQGWKGGGGLMKLITIKQFPLSGALLISDYPIPYW